MNAEIEKVTEKNTEELFNCEDCITVPPADVYETDDEYVIKVEMPGVSKENIDVTLDNKELEITGKINGEVPDSKNLKYAEFKLYNYRRKFVVGEGINSAELKAGFNNGLLTLTLPKREEIKPKKIEVRLEH